MKVLQVLPALQSGGVERGTLEIAEALRQQGHEAWVMSAGGAMVAELEALGGRHVHWALGKKSLWTLRHIPGLRRWLRQEAPDIVHIRSRMPGWLVYLAWRGLPLAQRPRLVSTVHGFYSVSGYSAVMCRGERVIAVSDSVRDYIEQHYAEVAGDRVRVIDRGVAAQQWPFGYQADAAWRARFTAQFPQTEGQWLLTLPGRLTRLKGHYDLLALLAALRQRALPVHALIVGGEDPKRQRYARQLREAVADAGLQAHVTFTGARRDLRDLYAHSRLVLSLSQQPESFGRTCLEALSLGVPVVGYAHGGVAEQLCTLFPAGAVPPGDKEALADCCARLLEANPPPVPLRNERYTLISMQQQTLALYAQLLDSAPA